MDHGFGDFGVNKINDAPSKKTEAALKRAETTAKKAAAAAKKTGKRKVTIASKAEAPPKLGTASKRNADQKERARIAAQLARLERRFGRMGNGSVQFPAYSPTMSLTQLQAIRESVEEQLNANGAEEMMLTVHDLFMKGIEWSAAKRRDIDLVGFAEYAARKDQIEYVEPELFELAAKYAHVLSRCVEQRYIQKVMMMVKEVHRYNTELPEDEVAAMLSKASVTPGQPSGSPAPQ